MNEIYSGLVSSPVNQKEVSIKNNVTYTFGGTVVETVPQQFIPEPTPIVLEAVDLGLPSGTKWANMNVGANTPEEEGWYFTWGNVDGYDYNDPTDEYDMYYGSPGASLETDIIQGGAYDAAAVNMGEDWVMPTDTQVQELIDNTTIVVLEDGKSIRLISKTNGNSILLPGTSDVHGHYYNLLFYAPSFWTTSYSNIDSSVAFSNRNCKSMNKGIHLQIRAVKNAS